VHRSEERVGNVEEGVMEWRVWKMEGYSESAKGGREGTTIECGGGRDRAGSVEKGKWSW
jgi:hypothetical protein